MVYPALLPLMRTPRLPAVDWTDAPADLNGLVRFVERRNLVSARVPSHFNWPVWYTPFSAQGFMIILNLKKYRSSLPCNDLGRPWGFPKVEAPRISGPSMARSALRTDRLYPQEIFLVLIPVRHWLDSAAGRIMSMKNFNEPATFRIVAPCPNQLRHRVPPFSRFLSVHSVAKSSYSFFSHTLFNFSIPSHILTSCKCFSVALRQLKACLPFQPKATC